MPTGHKHEEPGSPNQSREGVSPWRRAGAGLQRPGCWLPLICFSHVAPIAAGG